MGPSEHIIVFVYGLIVVAVPGLPILWLWSLLVFLRRTKWGRRETFAVGCLIIAPLIEWALLYPLIGPSQYRPPDFQHDGSSPQTIEYGTDPNQKAIPR
jgi:hypothetical protein